MKRWPLNKAYFWETAPFFRILLPFAAGIVLYEIVGPNAISNNLSIIAIIAAFALFATLALLKKTVGIFPVAGFLLLCCILFFSGYSVSYYNDIRNDKNWFGGSANDRLSYL